METKELELVVQEKTLGKLVTNATKIKLFVEKKLKSYSVDNYAGNEKKAAKDKAELNNAAKKLNDERIALEKEFMQPFEEFKIIVEDTKTMIKEASSKLDAIVKAKEQEKKDEKKKEITNFWNEQNFELVTLEKVFNQRWLNSTYKTQTIKEDIEKIIAEIEKDLAVLVSFGEDTAILRDIYLSTLNLNSTLQKGAELKANRERLAKFEEEKKLAEENAKKVAEEEKTMSMPMPEQPRQSFDSPCQKVKDNNVTTTVIEASFLMSFRGSKNIDIIKNFALNNGIKLIPTITIESSEKQILALRQFFTDNGIKYNKEQVTQLVMN